MNQAGVVLHPCVLHLIQSWKWLNVQHRSLSEQSLEVVTEASHRIPDRLHNIFEITHRSHTIHTHICTPQISLSISYISHHPPVRRRNHYVVSVLAFRSPPPPINPCDSRLFRGILSIWKHVVSLVECLNGSQMWMLDSFNPFPTPSQENDKLAERIATTALDAN